MSYGISYGTFSGHINVGRLNKAGTEFLAGKEDLTIPAVLAVAEWVLMQHGGEVELTAPGSPSFTITVERSETTS